MGVFLVAALAGCLDPLRGVAPMVVIKSTFTIAGTGQMDEFRMVPCFEAQYEMDPPRVVVQRTPWPEGSRMHVGFVLVLDMGDPWRPWVANASELPDTMALLSGSGGGLLSILDGSRGSSAFGMGSPFPRSESYTFQVRWDGEKAWLDDKELARGEPLTRMYRYHVETANASLDVREDMVATYVGKAHVELVAPDPTCAPAAPPPDVT
jgi:hypothetical protein